MIEVPRENVTILAVICEWPAVKVEASTVGKMIAIVAMIIREDKVSATAALNGDRFLPHDAEIMQKPRT